MKLIPYFIIFFIFSQNAFTQNQAPVIQSFQAAINNPNELIIIYDLFDNEDDDVEISFFKVNI